MAANNSLSNNRNVEHNLNLPSRVFYQINRPTFEKLNVNDIIYLNLSHFKILEANEGIETFGTSNIFYDYTNRGQKLPYMVNGKILNENYGNYGGAGNEISSNLRLFEYVDKHIEKGQPIFMAQILKKNHGGPYYYLAKILKVNTNVYPELNSLVGHNIPIYPKDGKINIYKINMKYLKKSIKKITNNKTERRMANSIARQKPGQTTVVGPLIKSFIPNNEGNMKKYLNKKNRTRRNRNATNGGKKRKTSKKRRR